MFVWIGFFWYFTRKTFRPNHSLIYRIKWDCLLFKFTSNNRKKNVDRWQIDTCLFPVLTLVHNFWFLFFFWFGPSFLFFECTCSLCTSNVTSKMCKGITPFLRAKIMYHFYFLWWWNISRYNNLICQMLLLFSCHWYAKSRRRRWRRQRQRWGQQQQHNCINIPSNVLSQFSIQALYIQHRNYEFPSGIWIAHFEH